MELFGLEEESEELDEATTSTYMRQSHHKKGTTERKRKSREQLSKEQKEKDKEDAVQRMRKNREELTKEEKEKEKKDAVQRMRKNREELTKEEKEKEKKDAVQRMRKNREELTKEEKEKEKKDAVQRMHKNREELTKEEKEKEKKENAQNKKIMRIETKQVHKQTHKSALHFSDNMLQSNIGTMSFKCKHCAAWHFKGELMAGHNDEYYQCCNYGKIQLDKQIPYPMELKQLFNIKNFTENIRNYNSALAFASFGATITPPPGRGPYCFRVHGQVYHQIGSLLPEKNKSPSYSQLYIIDSQMATQERLKKQVNLNLKPEIIQTYDSFLRKNSPFAQAYKKMYEVVQEAELNAKKHKTLPPTTMMVFDINKNIDRRRYNIPVCNEVAAIITLPPGETETIPYSVAVHTREGILKNLPLTSELCDPMVYPVLFPYGDPGWHTNMKITGKDDGNVTMCDYYSSKISVRNEWSPLLNGGKLFQQYLVDAFAKIEMNRLDYPRYHQAELRVESYQGLSDYIQTKAEELHITPGRRVILPSTFPGSPRAMQQSYQDAMAICRKFGKPDLFLTFTCNPRWPEIQQQLNPKQIASDRPDIVDRVFQLKLKELKNDLLKEQILGKVTAFCDVIEFQKRGLPHCHMLLILDEQDKLRTIEDIDMIIQAEIPNPMENPNLYNAVENYMIHGPCGKLNQSCYCMETAQDQDEPQCSRGFPKDFHEETSANVNGYTAYKRRTNKFTVMKNNIAIGNEYVVPYNPHLTLKYDAHINVEHCASVKSFKYLYKYVYKGHDCAKVKIENAQETLNWDEIQTYTESRYISAPEAVWRINKFPMENKSHSINRLPVHLPHEQQIYYKVGEEKEALNKAKSQDTKLTAFFKLNDPSAIDQHNNCYDETAAAIPYHEIPTNFFWNESHNCWQKRQRNIPIIGRMYTVSPKDTERYYLRLLLLHTPGAKSFKDLQNVNGEHCQTFHNAALKRGLLASDQEWRNCLSEAAYYKMPAELRQLFSIILLNCEPSEPKKLWEEFKEELAEDYIKKSENQNATSYAYQDINELLQVQGKSMSASYSIPQPNLIPQSKTAPPIDLAKLHTEGQEMIKNMNKEQLQAFNKIIYAASETHSKQKLYFIDGPAGSGKTYLYSALYKILKAKGYNIIMLAWSGIAATLLPEGQTVHSCFKLPLNLTTEVSCNIKPNTAVGKRIREAKAIFWDEAPMAPKVALEAIDQSLRDITGIPKPFGDKVIILGGDFRQVLPVARYTSKTTLLNMSIKNSKLWSNIEKIKLIHNMRAAPEEKEFTDWILKLGNDELQKNEKDEIKIPIHCLTNRNILDEVFGKEIDPRNTKKLSNSVILCPKNEDTLIINNDRIECQESLKLTQV